MTCKVWMESDGEIQHGNGKWKYIFKWCFHMFSIFMWVFGGVYNFVFFLKYSRSLKVLAIIGGETGNQHWGSASYPTCFFGTFFFRICSNCPVLVLRKESDGPKPTAAQGSGSVRGRSVDFQLWSSEVHDVIWGILWYARWKFGSHQSLVVLIVFCWHVLSKMHRLLLLLLLHHENSQSWCRVQQKSIFIQHELN